MLDRVREALFSTLGNRVEDARVLDLFAGSGSLGLEALSRGAVSARMVERDVRTLRLLKANVESLGLIERAEIVRGDANASASWEPPIPRTASTSCSSIRPIRCCATVRTRRTCVARSESDRRRSRCRRRRARAARAARLAPVAGYAGALEGASTARAALWPHARICLDRLRGGADS
jgi:hypothetical protein